MKDVRPGLILVAAILGAYVVFMPLEPVLYSDTYYGKLAAACQQNDGTQCCTESVKQMESQGYRLAEGKSAPDTYACPDGQQVDRLKCIGSKVWCAPKPMAFVGNEIVYYRGGGLAPWRERIHLHVNGTMEVETKNLRYTTIRSQYLDADTIGRIQRAVQNTDIGQLRSEYTCHEQCPTDLPTERIEIYTPKARQNVTIDQFDEIPPALKQLMQILQDAAADIPEAKPTPIALNENEQLNLGQGHSVHACGYDIQLMELGGATGSRNDWMQRFQIQNADGIMQDTLKTWGNESHTVRSNATGIQITIHSTYEPCMVCAAVPTARISVQCSTQATGPETLIYEGMVQNGQTIPLPEGRTLNIRIGSRCGPGEDGNGGCTFGGYELVPRMLDAQGKNVLNGISAMTKDGEENTDYAKFGIRIILESFDLNGESARIKVYQTTSTTLPESEMGGAQNTLEMQAGQTTEACGQSIRYEGLTRATGTRSDWRHSFDLLDAQGNVSDTVTAYGTAEHVMKFQLPEQTLTLNVKNIEQNEPYKATVQVDCGI